MAGGRNIQISRNDHPVPTQVFPIHTCMLLSLDSRFGKFAGTKTLCPRSSVTSIPSMVVAFADGPGSVTVLLTGIAVTTLEQSIPEQHSMGYQSCADTVMWTTTGITNVKKNSVATKTSMASRRFRIFRDIPGSFRVEGKLVSMQNSFYFHLTPLSKIRKLLKTKYCDTVQ